MFGYCNEKAEEIVPIKNNELDIYIQRQREEEVQEKIKAAQAQMESIDMTQKIPDKKRFGIFGKKK